MVNKIITDDEYFEMKWEYENKISSDFDEISNLEKSQKELKKKIKNYNKAEEHIAVLNKAETLTAEIVDQLIDKILVYSDKKVEIFFSFEDNKETR